MGTLLAVNIFAGPKIPSDFFCGEQESDRDTVAMSAAPFDMGPALKVSPLIKTARWTLLLAGMYYGYKRFNALQKIEDENVAHIAKMTPIWEAEKAAAKAKEGRAQLIQLAKDTGTPIPKDF